MAETWLPHEPPPQPSAKKSNAKRTLLLWLVLVVFFVVIYTMMEPGSGVADRGAVASTGYSGWWIALTAIGMFALWFAAFAWLLGGSRRYLAMKVPAVAALSEGNYARAAELFGEVARRFRHKPNFGAVAAYEQGHALIRAGDAAAAVGVLLGIERRVDLGVDGIRRAVAIELARAFAIGGDTDKALHWLASARTRKLGLGDASYEAAQLAAVEGLALCRAGRFADALRCYEQTWPIIEARLTVRDMREVWLVRAFATASTSTPREGGAIDAWLGLFRSTHPAPLIWLTVHWPELATFVVAHDVAPMSTRDARAVS
jgi:hypothetical protein